jgi:hypothetical protein
MVLANIAGDLIAVFIFKSLIAVAVASVVFTLIGVLIGFWYLNSELHINHRAIFSAGFEFYAGLYNKVRRNLTGFTSVKV